MKLEISNYGIIDTLDISLNPGLAVLVGPNGSGKSTIVDALYFALTGDTIDGRNVVDRINWGSVDKKASVKLNAGVFSVTRTIKNSGVSHRLELDDGTVLTKKGDVNERLFAIFNIENASVIKDVFFSAQLRATDLFDATESQRLTLLSRVFGFDRLEQCRAAIYKVLAETPVPVVNEETLAVLKDRVNSNKLKLEELNKQHDDASRQLQELNFDANRYLEVMAMPTDAERTAHVTALAKATKDIEDTEELFQKFDALAQKAEVLMNKLSEIIDYNDAKSKLQALEEELGELTAGISLDNLNSAKASIAQQKLALENEIKELESRKDADRAVCPLTGGTPCIELLRKFDPELVAQELAAKREALETLTNDEQQLTTYFNQAVAAVQKTGAVQRSIDEQNNVLAEHLKRLEALGIGPDADDKALLKELEAVGYCGDAAARHTELQTKREEAQRSIDFHSRWLEEHPSKAGISDEERTVLQDKKQTFEALNTTLSRLSFESQQTRKTLEDEDAILSKMQEDKERSRSFQHRADILREVRELMSKGQLQRLLLQTTIKSVNKEIDACARIFNFPYKLFIEESGSISFSSDDIDNADVKLLSGGQKYVAAIITRLAFGRVLRAAFPFVVLDEPSTCLDDNSRELLAGLLKALSDRAKQEKNYLIVPTHDELLVSAADATVHTN